MDWPLLKKSQVGTAMAYSNRVLGPPSYSATRCWSCFEVINQLLTLFGDVALFLTLDDVLSLVTSSKFLQILNDAAQCRKLKLEIAITISAMKLFVMATYTLEGDGPLALVAYEHYPNVQAVPKNLAGGNSSREQQLLSYARLVWNQLIATFDSSSTLTSN